MVLGPLRVSLKPCPHVPAKGMLIGRGRGPTQEIDRDDTLVSIAYTKALTKRPRCNRPEAKVRYSSVLD